VVFAITDMIRATIPVKSADEIEEAYKQISNISALNMIKINN